MDYFTKALLPLILLFCLDKGMAQVNANFSVSANVGCTPLSVQFTDQSTSSNGTIIQWQWNFGDGQSSTLENPLIEFTTVGQFDVNLTVTDDLGNSDDATIPNFITVNGLPTITASDDENICAGNQVTLTVNSSEGLLADYTWSTGEMAQNITVSPTETTMYSVTVQNDFGCEATDEVTVFVDTSPDVIILEGSSILACEGQIITLTAQGAFTYFWNNGLEGNTINVTNTGNYSVIGTNELGCTNSANVYVEFGAPPIANAGEDVTICLGETVNLFANGGENYVWNNGLTFQTNTVSPTENTTYNVTVSNIYGCTDIDKVTVYVNDTTAINLGDNQSICNGDIITLEVSGAPGPFSWSTGQTANTINVSPENTTTYTAQYTNVLGCTSTTSTIIFVNPTPTVNAGDDVIICEGDSYTITPSGADYYQWEDGTISDTWITTEANAYTVTGFTNEGCSNTDVIQISVAPSPELSINDLNICETDFPYTYHPPAGFETFLWSDGTNGDTLLITQPGSFTLQAFDANNCSAFDAFEVFLLETDTTEIYSNEPIINYPDYDFIVHCESPEFEVFASNEDLPYLWSSGGIVSPQSITVTNNVKTVVWLETLNDNGCTARDSIILYNDNQCVWPGDTDYDGIVNNFDIFNIGLGFGTTSIYPRFNPSINWEAQAAVHWYENFTTSNLNYKYADCNGDGTINFLDVEAIHQNYFQTWGSKNTQINTPNQTPIFVKLSVDTLYYNPEVLNTITASVHLGTSNEIAQNIYGVAFTLSNNTNFVNPHNTTVNYSNNWLNDDNNIVYVDNIDEFTSSIDVGMVKIDHANSSGDGVIFQTEMAMIDNIDGKTNNLPLNPFIVSLSNIKIINSQGETIPCTNGNPDTTYINFDAAHTQYNNPQNSFFITPNPASNFIQIHHTNNQKASFTIYNIDGHSLINGNASYNHNSTLVNISSLSNGVYFVSFSTEQSTILQKLIILK